MADACRDPLLQRCTSAVLYEGSLTKAMDVSEGPKKLVHVEADVRHRHGLLEFGIVSGGAVDCFWNVFEDKVEVDFILLLALAVRVEEGPKVDDVRVRDEAHDLQLSILFEPYRHQLHLLKLILS